MSALAACYHRDGRPIAPGLIVSMLEAVPYRGVDGTSVRTWDSVALGQARLTVTPEERDERQPLVSLNSGCAVVADIRLDNRDELLAEFGGHVPTTISDAALVLRVYERWGTAFVDHLLGDFAVVIWDPRERRMVCARDTSGQRALYYRLDDATFVAASEIHQIFQDPAVPIEPNDEHIETFLTPQYMFRNEPQLPTTFYKDIHLLPAGHLLVVNEDSHRIERYWSLNPRREIRYRRDEDYAEHFRELLRTAVVARLRSTAPVGVLLSGGLDSSSIATTALAHYRDTSGGTGGLISFSIVFDGLDCDERPLIESIQAKYGHDARYIPSGDFAGRLRLTPTGFMEGPNMGVGAERDAMFRTIASAGVRVILTGDIADGCVGGSWLVFDSLLRQGRLRVLYQHMQAYRHAIDPSWRRIALYTLAPQLPLSLQRRVMLLRRQRQNSYLQHKLLPDWMPERLRSHISERAVAEAIEAEQNRIFTNETRQFESSTLYPPTIARHPAPWPIQIARPYADRRLHEFLLAIPPEQKFSIDPNGGSSYARSKSLIRRGLEGILPDEIRLRTNKTVFGQVTDNEVQRQWDDYEATFGPGKRSEISQRGYVEPDRFWDRLIQARDGVKKTDTVYLMQMIGLETWLRTFRLPRAERLTIHAYPETTISPPEGTIVMDAVAAL